MRHSDITLTSGVGLGQRPRFLVLTKMSAASGDENVNNYSPQCRWLAVDIYWAARRRSKYQPLAVSVYAEKLYFSKNAQTALTCSAVALPPLVATAPVISANCTSTIPHHWWGGGGYSFILAI